MNIKPFIQRVQENVIEEMVAYRKEDKDCGYTLGHVRKCRRLLLGYLKNLNGMVAPTDEKIMQQVKSLTLALNKLNEKTDYCLIETDAREALWKIIQESAVACGLTDPAEDVTEEWREW